MHGHTDTHAVVRGKQVGKEMIKYTAADDDVDNEEDNGGGREKKSRKKIAKRNGRCGMLAWAGWDGRSVRE